MMYNIYFDNGSGLEHVGTLNEKVYDLVLPALEKIAKAVSCELVESLIE